jgi:GxxExxY protein
LNHQGTKGTKEHQVDPELDALAREVVDAAFKVHRALGPGLLESAYETCLEIELGRRGISVQRQVAVSIAYEGETVPEAFRVDMVVGERLLVELKAVEQVLPIHQAQLLTYLRLTGSRIGLLINFNVQLIRDGIKRLIV